MAQEFKKGDVVKLKSGGPKMTIEGYKSNISIGSRPTTYSTSKVVASWFSNEKLTRETFDVEAIEIAKD